MHLECLPGNGLKVLGKLKNLLKTSGFVLAGGTALALSIGHRLSEDLDLFTKKRFSTERLFREMQKLGLGPVVQQEEKGTLVTFAGGTKVSMMQYDYPFLEKTERINGVPVAGVIDIGSMKTVAISQRGARRNFVDLYFILEQVPFRKVAENMINRFGTDRINPVHIGKSLVYFADADVDPDPRYCGKVKPDWKSIKAFYKKNVQQMVIDMHKAKESLENK